MAYRILIEPAAARRLRSVSPYIVQGLGRRLLELLESDALGKPAVAGEGPFHIDIPGASVSCRNDAREETLTVLDVEEREGIAAAAS
jgi:hypothetical protein